MPRLRAYKPRIVDWHPTAAFLRVHILGKLKLGVTVSLIDEEWVVIAQETPATNVQAFLDAHSHLIVGVFAELVPALEAGETFGRAWLNGHVKRSDACACEPIASAA